MRRVFTKYTERGVSFGRSAIIYYNDDGPYLLELEDGRGNEVYREDNPKDWHNTARNWIDNNILPPDSESVTSVVSDDIPF